VRIEEKLDFGKVVGMRVGYAPIGKPLISVIFYYIDGLLIDTGAFNTRPSVKRFVESNVVNQIALTPYHEDHAGNAGYLEKTCAIPVYGHEATISALKRKVPLKPYEYYMFGRLEKANITPLPDVIETKNYQFYPVHTPGHSIDHVVYHERNEGWLFSGDLFLGSRIKFFRKDEDILQTIISLQKTIALDFDHLFCGHNPKIGEPKPFLKAKLEQLMQLMSDVKKLINEGLSDKEILRTLSKGKEVHLARCITLGDVSYKYMVASALHALRQTPSVESLPK